MNVYLKITKLSTTLLLSVKFIFFQLSLIMQLIFGMFPFKSLKLKASTNKNFIFNDVQNERAVARATGTCWYNQFRRMR